jgi:hypothetical protein
MKPVYLNHQLIGFARTWTMVAALIFIATGHPVDTRRFTARAIAHGRLSADGWRAVETPDRFSICIGADQ